MKRIAYISFVALLLCFAACEKTGSSGGEGAGAEIGIRLPGGTSYVSGQDVIVLGSGFSASDTFILVDAGGTETVIQGVTVTSSGFFFTLSVSAGTYSLVVLAEDGERREIGVITVSERTLSIVVSYDNGSRVIRSAPGIPSRSLLSLRKWSLLTNRQKLMFNLIFLVS